MATTVILTAEEKVRFATDLLKLTAGSARDYSADTLRKKMLWVAAILEDDHDKRMRLAEELAAEGEKLDKDLADLAEDEFDDEEATPCA